MQNENITNLEEFHAFVGKVIMRCQFIEHDIKWIFSGLSGGDIYKNFENLLKEKETLGSVIFRLKELDGATYNYFSASDYRLLSKITYTRNYWAHESYVDFMYERGDEWRAAFIRQSARLKTDYEWLFTLSKRIEAVRLDLLRRLNKI
ncbi:MAG: hypothetical protein SOX77_03900 [Candidatus Borkfalkiaceae bacterium]|nr:hypothetical protein [Christensenellaceae bacterium]